MHVRAKCTPIDYGAIDPFPGRLVSGPEPSLPRLVAEVRHATEVERLLLAPPTFPPVCLREPAELGGPDLVPMQFQSVSGQPLAGVSAEALRFALVLEAEREVVRIADDYRVASRSPLAPCVVEPVVKHLVQVDAGVETVPPCGAPLLVSVRSVPSRTPASSHLTISRMAPMRLRIPDLPHVQDAGHASLEGAG